MHVDRRPRPIMGNINVCDSGGTNIPGTVNPYGCFGGAPVGERHALEVHGRGILDAAAEAREPKPEAGVLRGGRHRDTIPGARLRSNTPGEHTIQHQHNLSLTKPPLSGKQYGTREGDGRGLTIEAPLPPFAVLVLLHPQPRQLLLTRPQHPRVERRVPHAFRLQLWRRKSLARRRQVAVMRRCRSLEGGRGGGDHPQAGAM